MSRLNSFIDRIRDSIKWTQENGDKTGLRAIHYTHYDAMARAEKLDSLQWARDVYERAMGPIFDIDDVERELDNAVPYEDDYGQWIQSTYIGTVFSEFPSGKYYMPWACGNVTKWEAECDEIWRERAEEELETIGACMISGDGNPCDLYIMRSCDNPYDTASDYLPEEYPTAAILLSYPRLCIGQADDLRLENDAYRYWTSRCQEDSEGNPLVSIETIIDGKWTTIAEYYTPDDVSIVPLQGPYSAIPSGKK